MCYLYDFMKCFVRNDEIKLWNQIIIIVNIIIIIIIIYWTMMVGYSSTDRIFEYYPGEPVCKEIAATL